MWEPWRADGVTGPWSRAPREPGCGRAVRLLSRGCELAGVPEVVERVLSLSSPRSLPTNRADDESPTLELGC